MPRTPLRRPILAQLAGINDQLCFFLFAESEVEQGLARFPTTDDSRYSSELFPSNPHARKIYVTLSGLRGFQISNRTFTLGSFFAASYEVLAGYCNPALRFVEQLRAQPLLRSTSADREERFAETLRDSGVTPPAPEVVNTFKYLRLRRNHFVHLGDDVRPELRRLMEDRGQALNAFWRDTREPIDFRDPSFLETFTDEETIVLLKLIRIVLELLDDAAIAAIELPLLIDAEAAAGQRRSRSGVGAQIARRILLNYGISVEPADVNKRLKRGDAD